VPFKPAFGVTDQLARGAIARDTGLPREHRLGMAAQVWGDAVAVLEPQRTQAQRHDEHDAAKKDKGFAHGDKGDATLWIKGTLPFYTIFRASI